MTQPIITLLHPGNMGATIGACAKTSGARVLWVADGRSAASRARAEQAGLVAAASLADGVAQSDIVLSVCPPEFASETAVKVAAQKFTGIYVDGNAVARTTAEAIGRIVTDAGASYVDGGIIGSPVRKAGTTRMYLSGEKAGEIAQLFSASMLDARVVSAVPGEASALKVVYAAWTKGTDALILAIRALAAHEGVDQALLNEWKVSQPALEPKSIKAAAAVAPKMWRYVGEMREIAEAFKSAGLPSGFHSAAAEVSERLAGFKDQTEPGPTIAAVLEKLLRPS
jgi:3-hydroxyisobutyrate dehydrogenase-like beta-hydroxyacid dehydrogenase